MDKDYLPSEKVGNALNEKYIFLHYPTGHPENDRVEAMFNVGSHPTFLVLDENGKLLSRVSGASDVEDEFISTMVSLSDPENYIESKRKGFRDGSVSAEGFFRYASSSDLNHDMSEALEKLYVEAVEKDRIDEFIKEYLDFMTLFYYDKVNSGFYDFLCSDEGQKRIISGGKINSDMCVSAVDVIVENSLKYMLLSGDEVDEDEYVKVGNIIGKSPSKALKILYDAIIPVREKGIAVIFDLACEKFDTLSQADLFSFQYYLYRQKYFLKDSQGAREFVGKALESAEGRNKRIWQGLYDEISGK